MIAYAINDIQKPMTRHEIVESCHYQMPRSSVLHGIDVLLKIGALVDSGERELGPELVPAFRFRYEKYKLATDWQQLLDRYYLLPAVYLAGKINGADYEAQRAGDSQDWRWPLIGNDLFHWNCTDAFDYENWPPVVTTTCHYVGPFYKYGKSHDGYQENDRHGVGAGHFPGWAMSGLSQTKTVKNCINSITRAEIFFAWLNTTDAHGTLMEIAIACQHKLQQIVLVVPPCNCPKTLDDWLTEVSDELATTVSEHTCVQYQVWFAQALVRNSGGEVIYSDDPIQEYYKVIARWNRTNQKFNSVPEKEFWTKVINDPDKGLLYKDIVSQHPVGKYRIDFAIPELKFGIEIDGLAYHNGQDSFMKDRSRQREIESQGWRIVRFAAKEISLDVDKCFREAEAIALELSQALVGAK
jgi:very-short-patch-repair endonuclease